MTIPVDFSKYYKTISNKELLNILDNPEDYQPLAIEAAKKEFSDRQLSESAIKEAREQINADQLQKENQRKKTRAIEEKVRASGQTLMETLNPIQSGISTTDKTIRIIVVGLGLLYLYLLITDFDELLGFVNDIEFYPVASIFLLLPFILLPVALVLFWKRKKIGWMLLAIFLTFSAIVAAWGLVQAILPKPEYGFFLDNLTTEMPILSIIIQLLFYGGMLYVICRKKLRAAYSISENKMIGIISVSAIVSFFLVYGNS